MLKTFTFLLWGLLLACTTSLFAQPINDACADAIDITSAFAVGPTDTMTVGPYTNVDATPGGIPDATCWFDAADNGSVWFTFTAAAGTYDIVTSLTCAGIDPDNLNPDTQFLLYSGSCGSFTQVACNDDIGGGVFLAGLFGVDLEAGVTYYLAVDGWGDDTGAFFQGEFCIQVNQGAGFSCADASTGEYILESPSPEICFNDTLFLTMTAPAVIPPLGGSGLDYFHWVVTSADISDTTISVYPDATVFLAQFGQNAGAYDLVYVNNPANGLPTGASYWFTPVIAANAINTDGTFPGLDFSEGCFLAGQSIEITFLDSVGQLSVTVDLMLDPDMTMGGATATANASGGSGNYTYLWSTGDTTATVDSLGLGTYSVTITDPQGCVADVVGTVEVTEEPYPDDCGDAAQIDTLFGGEMGVLMTSSLFDNLTATTDTTDNVDAAACFLEDPESGEPILNATIWFTFVGDGNPYSIKTVNCGATNYIEDTQLLLFSGVQCDSLTPVACGEDNFVTGALEAEVIIQTEPGVTYYLMMDGYSQETGEFCLEVTQMEFIGCDDIDPGTPVLASSVDVCPDDDISIILQDPAVVPELPGINVFLYLITISDITNSTNLASVDAAIVGNSPNQLLGYDFNAPASVFGGNVGTFYVTPIVIGGANADEGSTLSDLDLTYGCIQIGTSIELNLLPEVTLAGEGTSTPANEVNGSNDGTATVTVTGGSGDYTYDWGTGQDSATITGLAAGTYMVTITDNEACAEPLVVSVMVDFISSTNDPQLAQAIEVFPNPATNQFNLRYNLSSSQDLTINLVNSLGQSVQTQRLTNVHSGSLQLDISQLSSGFYQLHVSDGQRQTVKPLVIK